VSEQDWQTAVLGELGLPQAGLVTPVPSTRPANQPVTAEPPQIPPTQDEPVPVESVLETGPTEAPPQGDEWGSAAEPPSAQVHSAPQPPAEQTVRSVEPLPEAPADQVVGQAGEPRLDQAEWTPERVAWPENQPQVAAGHPPAQEQVAPAQPILEQREPAVDQLQAADDLVRRARHGDPVMRRVGRGVRRAVGTSASHDARVSGDIDGILQRPVASCRRIAVTSIRGGAGKTTVAVLAATLIAQYRQDRVLAIDSDSGLGSLPLRTGINAEWSLHDFVAANTRSWEETSRYLDRTPNGLWVLSSTSGGRIGADLTLAAFQAAAGQMSRYFACMVIDCGAGLLAELQRGVLAEAHAQVMVTPGTADGALSARGALDWMVRNGYEQLVARTVIALVTHTPHVDAHLGRAAQMLSAGGVPVVHVPYDRHLAAGTAIDPERIAQTTRSAAIQIAVEAFNRALTI
jgi:MinD-like ATPase involved in chromosome partitioning or flagellar assembly